MRGWRSSPSNLTNLDDDRADLVFDVHSAITQEGGTTATVWVRLDAAPSAEVDIPLGSSNPAEATVSRRAFALVRRAGQRPRRLWSRAWTTRSSTGRTDRVQTGTASSSDAGWDGRDPVDLFGVNLDDEARSPIWCGSA